MIDQTTLPPEVLAAPFARRRKFYGLRQAKPRKPVDQLFMPSRPISFAPKIEVRKNEKIPSKRIFASGLEVNRSIAVIFYEEKTPAAEIINNWTILSEIRSPFRKINEDES